MRAITIAFLAILVASIGACDDGGPRGTDSGTDGDTDTDTDTDTDADSDTDSDADECASGACCDSTTHTFQPSSFQCDSWNEYRCDGAGCGADAQQRPVSQYCSGASASCDGSLTEGDWTTIDDCGDGQLCVTDGTSYSECGTDMGAFGCECHLNNNWYDSASGLCWQEMGSSSAMTWANAISYCEESSWGGFTDWVLPEIDELISLMRGCVNGVATGDLSASNCGVEDPGCLESSCVEGADCDYCEYKDGPGAGGCYWDPDLSGVCMATWSSSPYSSDRSWFVGFGWGSVSNDAIEDEAAARCVRYEP